jgi:hypothetical protein
LKVPLRKKSANPLKTQTTPKRTALIDETKVTKYKKTTGQDEDIFSTVCSGAPKGNRPRRVKNRWYNFEAPIYRRAVPSRKNIIP